MIQLFSIEICAIMPLAMTACAGNRPTNSNGKSSTLPPETGPSAQQEGNALCGIFPSSGSKKDLMVAVSEEGTDGVPLAVMGGEGIGRRFSYMLNTFSAIGSR